MANELSQGIDGYSDDEEEPLEAMFSGIIFVSKWKRDNQNFYLGTIPIPSQHDPTEKWTMLINFGYNDPNVDISGVDFTSVNAVIVAQGTE